MNGIEASIKIHDRHQIELKFLYPLDSGKPVTEFHVETYMFLPPSLGISEETYPKADYYADSQQYIRFKTPDFLLRQICQEGDSPWNRLKTRVQALVDRPFDAEVQREYQRSLKMFCSIVKTSLRDEAYFIEKLPDREETENFVKNYVERASEIATRFRELRDLLLVPVINERLYGLYLFADEYISLVLDKYRYGLLLFLDRVDVDNRKKIKGLLLDQLNAELRYRESRNYPSIPKADSDNEEFLFRMGALKKIMSGILFLKKHARREGVVLEQLTMGLAAGLSMTFATAAAFLGRDWWGDMTMTFFVSLVVAYIFKDRMKELTRVYVYRKLQKLLYDRKTTIENSNGKVFATCRERVGFVREKDLDPRLLSLRNRDYLTELENDRVGENILVSTKEITIFPRRENDMTRQDHVEGINEILRHNIQRFLAKMDNPRKNLLLPDKSGYRAVNGSRVYHIHLLMKYHEKDAAPNFKHFRLVLNQRGVKRIEHIGC